MIDLWAAIGFAWVTLVVGFVFGAWWNADAYERGRRDGERGRTDW